MKLVIKILITKSFILYFLIFYILIFYGRKMYYVCNKTKNFKKCDVLESMRCRKQTHLSS